MRRILILMMMVVSSCVYIPDSPSSSCAEFNEEDFFELNLTSQEVKTNEKFVYCLIESLKDTTISDCEFANRVFALSDYLNFHFCGIDCEDSEWLSLDKASRLNTRKIITIGCLEYRSSPLFMSKINNLSCDVVDLYEFCNTKIINDEQVKEAFREKLETIYNECR